MAKTVDDLIESRKGRENILAQFGGELPQSIMRYNSSDRAMDETVGQNETSRMPDSAAFRMSGISVRGETGGLSRFPQNVGRKLLMLYTKPGDWVNDPFAGHNSRMELCWRAGRNYRGNDISAKFQEMNKQVLAKLENERDGDLFGEDHFTAQVELSIGDSRQLPWENESGDFTITSPPYYNLEHYGDEPQQLGIGARSYQDFLNRLSEVCAQNFRVLKRGRFAVWFVNDFRLDGLFYSYHSDLIRLMERAGFVQHDIAIVDLGSRIAASFANQVIERKLLPKRHEYALVFIRPR